MGEPHEEPLSSTLSSAVTSGVEGTSGVSGNGSDADISTGSRTKVSRREAGVLKVRNSFVGERSAAGVLAGVSLQAGTRLPPRLARARGSIDLRRRWPPRGIKDVSIA